MKAELKPGARSRRTVGQSKAKTGVKALSKTGRQQQRTR